LDRFAGRSTKNSMDGRGRWLDNVYMLFVSNSSSLFRISCSEM
jgi:hypothetical protein